MDDTVVDDELVDALRALTTDPADLGSTDRFAAKAHRLPHAIRQRLLTQLDLFGIAHGVLALRDGADRAGLVAALRRASAVDGLLAGIDMAAAPVRYRRLTEAHVAEFPAAGEMDDVAARMAAAIEVVRAAGMTVDERRHRGGASAARDHLAAVLPRAGVPAAPLLRRRHRPRLVAVMGTRRRRRGATGATEP